MVKPVELVDIVNEADEVTGTITRREVDEHPDLCRVRASRVILYDAEGKVLVQQRAHVKSTYGDCYDVGVGETLFSSESYPLGAQRGIKEELFYGRKNVSLELIAVQPVFPGTFSVKGINKNYRQYSWQYDPEVHGVIVLDPEEVAAAKFVSGPQLESLIKEKEFSPVGRFTAELVVYAMGFQPYHFIDIIKKLSPKQLESLPVLSAGT